MPNTASAERRMRSNATKQAHNRRLKSRLKRLEGSFAELATAGKQAEAGQALRAVSSALDKAAKVGVIHRATASRKRSRLAIRLAALKTSPAA